MLPPLQLALLRAFALHLVAEAGAGNTDTDDAQYVSINVTATLGGNTTSVVGNRYLRGHPEGYTCDADGNLLTDGRWHYAWDAENRLIQLTTADDAVGAGLPKQKITFAYDDQGRKAQKKVFSWNSGTSAWNTTPDVNLLYLYDGQNLIAEVDATGTPAVARSYVWGLGGPVGGLLMASLSDGTTSQAVYYGYDGNGNVNALVDTSGNLVGSYDYDPFGKLVQMTGTWAAYNPMRFSTKYAEGASAYGSADVGLYYYGARFYNPDTGRFLNRDPLEELGGLNLYGFCHNDGVNLVDPDGRCFSGAWLSTLFDDSSLTSLADLSLNDILDLINRVTKDGFLYGPNGAPLGPNNFDDLDPQETENLLMPKVPISLFPGLVPYADPSKDPNAKPGAASMIVQIVFGGGGNSNAPAQHAAKPGYSGVTVNADGTVTANGEEATKKVVEATATANGATGVTADATALIAGQARIGSNGVLYMNGWGGNQYVSTAKVGEIAEGVSQGAFALGILIDGVGVINGAITPTHAAVNTGVGGASLYIGGPVGATLGAGYFFLDTFYPGGASQWLRDAETPPDGWQPGDPLIGDVGL